MSTIAPVLAFNTLPEEAQELLGNNLKALKRLLSENADDASGNAPSLDFGETLKLQEQKTIKVPQVPMKDSGVLAALDILETLGNIIPTQSINEKNSKIHVLQNHQVFIEVSDSFNVKEGDVFAILCKLRREFGTAANAATQLKKCPEIVDVEKSNQTYSLNGAPVKGVVLTPQASESLLRKLGEKALATSDFLSSDEKPKMQAVVDNKKEKQEIYPGQ